MTYKENLGVKANGIVIMVIFLTHILGHYKTNKQKF